MSLVFQNIDPPPRSPPGECVLPPNKGGGYTLAGRKGRRGSIFWKTREIGLPSYSNNISTLYSDISKFPLSIPILKAECYWSEYFSPPSVDNPLNTCNREILKFLYINRFSTGPLHSCKSFSGLVFELAGIFAMEDRLPAINNTVSRQLRISAIQRVDDFPYR
jgi:hypothetical protein